MPDIHYLDNNNVYYAPRMGAAFSDAVTGMMRLKLAQQQREDERQRTIAEFQLARQRLGLEQERETREAKSSSIQDTERLSIMDAAKTGANAMGRLYDTGSMAPTIENARGMDIQDLARSLAYVRGTNPQAAGRVLEPQQFNPGPVYDWNAMFTQGTPQPRMTVPMNPYQSQQVDLRSQANDVALQRLQMQMAHQQAMNDYLMQVLQERKRHDVETEKTAEDKSDPFGIKAQIKARTGGTNTTSNIKSIRQISE